MKRVYVSIIAIVASVSLIYVFSSIHQFDKQKVNNIAQVLKKTPYLWRFQLSRSGNRLQDIDKWTKSFTKIQYFQHAQVF
jgi:hypothetical protein